MALKYTVDMPPKPSISDLATREVTISLNAAEDIKNLNPDDTSFTFITEAGVSAHHFLPVDILPVCSRSSAIILPRTL